MPEARNNHNTNPHIVLFVGSLAVFCVSLILGYISQHEAMWGGIVVGSILLTFVNRPGFAGGSNS